MTRADGELKTKIHRAYKPVTWQAVAERVLGACIAAPKTQWREPYPHTVIPYSSEISFAKLDRNVEGVGDIILTRIAGQRKGLYLSDPLDEYAFIRGEEARSGGAWAYPEEWGTWACQNGGEIALGLAANDSQIYYVFLRLQTSGPVAERTVKILANGDLSWEGLIGSRSKDICLRVRRKLAGSSGWQLRIRAQVNLTQELREQIAAIDSRIPTIGFERMIVVPENDLKTRLDILYTLLL